MIFFPKMPEFYIKIVRKIFFPNFRGTRAPLYPPSPTPMPKSLMKHLEIAEMISTIQMLFLMLHQRYQSSKGNDMDMGD